jgi:small subunit ribosomal protein S17
VVSDVQDKTIIVRVDRLTTHPLYAKTIRVSKKYHVHDEANEANVGDTVRITETRPISKLKRWRWRRSSSARSSRQPHRNGPTRHDTPPDKATV